MLSLAREKALKQEGYAVGQTFDPSEYPLSPTPDRVLHEADARRLKGEARQAFIAGVASGRLARHSAERWTRQEEGGAA